MVSFTSEQNYYLYPGPMDMRKDIDGLSDIVRQEMCQDPTRLNGVFLFISKNRRMMKILYRGLKRFELTKIRFAYSGGYPFSISGDIRSVPS